jgi:hypothetical protein
MPPMMISFTESARKSTAWWRAEKLRDTSKDRAARRRLHMRLERHHTGLLRRLDHLVQHPKQLDRTSSLVVPCAEQRLRSV